MRRQTGRKHSGTRGSMLIEFALVAVLLCLLLMVFVELGRMILVYNSVTQAARAGARYAIVHGSSRPAGTCVDCASGPGNISAIQTVVRNFAGTAPLTAADVTVSVTYPGSARCQGTFNKPGCPVNVTAGYPYEPLLAYLPLRVTLGSTSQGVITF